jgi:hypothetical protein
MNQTTRIASAVALSLLAFASCKKDDNNSNGPAVKEYTVPTTYTFSNVDFTKSNQLAKMAVEIDAYLKTANTGSTVVTLDQTKVNNMFANTGNPFTNPDLNSAGINITNYSDNASLYKSFADSMLIFNTGATAAQGTGGFVARGTNKIIVSPTGLEFGQGFLKGTMGALFFKKAVDVLTSVKAISATDTAAAQAKWDEAFGYLAIPVNYDSSITYASTDVNRPLLWGGYLAERGKPIQAGGTIFQAFLKGRAAIGGYDVATRDAQVDIIIAKWEQLAAAAALNYVTSPTASASIGNLGTQFHGLSEGFGFIMSLQYRPANSKLSQADYQTLYNIIHKDFYVLINQPGFTDLVTAQNILKNSYGL